jgi:two-component sensor histidine kinase
LPISRQQSETDARSVQGIPASRLRRSLQEKDVLLKEIHHRVKHNLEVVNSLLSLQTDRIVDETARELLEETANRVRAIADIHRLLYTSPDLVHVDIGRFLASVSESLFSFYGVRPDRVRLIVETNDVQVNVQQAVPIALILNELLSNALKHAFPEGRSGSIQIQLCSHGDRGVLSVTDDGVGFARETKRTSSTLGLELVRVLVDQLRGELEQSSAPGTQYRITFLYADMDVVMCGVEKCQPRAATIKKRTQRDFELTTENTENHRESCFSVVLAATSECQPKRQLNLAISPGRTGDRSYVPGTHSRSGERELGSVERIEHFHAECKYPLFPQPKTLGQRQVDVRPSRSAEHVPR